MKLTKVTVAYTITLLKIFINGLFEFREGALSALRNRTLDAKLLD